MDTCGQNWPFIKFIARLKGNDDLILLLSPLPFSQLAVSNANVPLYAYLK